MKKVLIYDITPCGRRKLDSKKLYNYFLKNNYIIVRKPKEADIIVINTCAYSDERARFALDKIKELQKYNIELIVVGCLPGIEKEQLKEVFAGKTVSTKDLDDIDKLFPDNKVKFKSLDDGNIFWRNTLEQEYIRKIKILIENNRIFKKIKSLIIEHLRKELLLLYFSRDEVFHVRISQGCPANCSYCAIRKAIGPLISKSIGQCIKEVKDGLNKGYKKFFITADDIGSYGIDIGKTFPHLLEKIIDLNGDFSIGIESLRPVWIIKYFKEIERLLLSGKIEFIGCSIQSGSSRILKLMNRYHNTEKIRESILKIKKTKPNLILITEIIIGFPSETNEEFNNTIRLIRDLKFDIGYIYKYSDRTGTEAENIREKVPELELKKRMNFIKLYLRKLGYNVRYERNKTVLIFSS